MEKFSTYFGLKLSYTIFAVTEQLSKTLQSKDICAQEATFAVTKTVSFLQRQRSDSGFMHFYKRIIEESKDITEAPVLPRQRQLPKRYNDGAIGHTCYWPYFSNT